MSSRELRALDTSNRLETRTRSQKNAMSDVTMLQEEVDELKARLRQSQEELVQKSKEAERLQVVAEETKAEAAEVLETLTQSESARENLEMKSELTLLRTVDRLRSEHQLSLAAEQKRMDSLVQDIKSTHVIEKEHLLRGIADLEKASAEAGRTTRSVSNFDDQLPDRSRRLSDGGGTGTEAPLVSESSSSTGTSIVSSAAFSTCGTQVWGLCLVVEFLLLL